MSTRNEILETCLARLAAGESLANCLADYPADAEWLRPLLTTANQLHALPAQKLSPTTDRAIQEQLRQAITANQVNVPQLRRPRFKFMEDRMKNSSRFLTKWLPRVVVAGTAVALLVIFITQFTDLIPSVGNPITAIAAGNTSVSRRSCLAE